MPGRTCHVSRGLAIALVLLLSVARAAMGADELVRDALAAEHRFDAARALELFLAANTAHPGDPFVLQKIARQYSDLAADQPDAAGRRHYVELALTYAEQAVALDPKDPVNVLSLAVCHGKLALHGDIQTRLRYSRLVRQEAEQALALDPSYAWAHHVLGRWHYEIASLAGAKRWVVRMFFGGLPDASYREAVAHLERAVALEPDDPSHRVELGFAYAAAGRSAEARAAWAAGLAMPDRSKNDAAAKRRAREALGGA